VVVQLGRSHTDQLFNLQWLVRRFGRLILLLFTQGLRGRLFINQSFFEQLHGAGGWRTKVQKCDPHDDGQPRQALRPTGKVTVDGQGL
jgi:hypothetical protein